MCFVSVYALRNRALLVTINHEAIDRSAPRFRTPQMHPPIMAEHSGSREKEDESVFVTKIEFDATINTWISS